MIAPVSMRAQGGATLVVGLIMLVLITLMVTTAFKLSTGNLKSVGNMQFRNEAIAAANKRIEEVLSTDFTTVAPANPVDVDIDGDGNGDYQVTVAVPTCVRASVALLGTPSDLKLPSMTTKTHWNTIWEIDAAVDDTVTGASTRVRQGVRILLTNAQKDSLCP